MKRYTARERIAQIRQRSQRLLKESVSDQNFKPLFSQTASHSSFATEVEPSIKSSGVTPTNLMRRNLNLQIPINSVSPERRRDLGSPHLKLAVKPFLSPTHKRLTPQPSEVGRLLKAKAMELSQVLADKQRLEEELAAQTALNQKLTLENELLRNSASHRHPTAHTPRHLESAMSHFRVKLEKFVSRRRT
jgi:hypothetical protein